MEGDFGVYEYERIKNVLDKFIFFLRRKKILEDYEIKEYYIRDKIFIVRIFKFEDDGLFSDKNNVVEIE